MLRRAAQASDRPQRQKTAPTRHSDVQAQEILDTETRNAMKREQARRRQQAASERAALQTAAGPPQLPSISTTASANAIPAIPCVSSGRGVCWRCGGQYALKKDKTMRDHYCTPRM